MDSTVEGVLLDQSKCHNLSIEEKREFVYEVSKWSHGASEMLQAWSRQEILEILCAEMGKERKYTGLTKLKIIENLLKIVSEKKSLEHGAAADLEKLSSPATQRNAKRQRKLDYPSRLPIAASNLSVSSSDGDFPNAIYCKNSACQAKLGREDPFCKRCSCCICYQYDDNKDPSLWLLCSSEPPFEGVSCGMSCHLECALKHERSGISKDGQHAGLDGAFYCVYCRKVNDLLGCCRKQLVMAKDTRRVDILCYRLSLSQKLLIGNEKYFKVYDTVDEAVKKLETEVGPLTGLPVKMGRGIVNRLSSGPEVQKLCALAVNSLDSLLSSAVSRMFPKTMVEGSCLTAKNMIRAEAVGPTSLTLVLGPKEDPSSEGIQSYSIWHRKAHEIDYPEVETCTLLVPNTKFVVSGLTPATEYIFKAIAFNWKREVSRCETRFSTAVGQFDVQKSLVEERVQSPATNCSSLSNPSSVEENNNIIPYTDPKENQADNYHNYCKDANKIVSTDVSNGTNNCNSIASEIALVDVVSVLEGKPVNGETGTERIPDDLQRENQKSVETQIIETNPAQAGLACAPIGVTSEAGLPITPSKSENPMDGLGRTRRPKRAHEALLDNGSGKEEGPGAGSGSSSKKRSEKRVNEEGTGNGPSDKDFEFYVKVIRWLECEGHIEKNFRQKFLTWYSLRATPQEVRIVKVFVDTFIEDPASLAEQLVDSFSDSVSSNRSTVVPAGFCMKLWH